MDVTIIVFLRENGTPTQKSIFQRPKKRPERKLRLSRQRINTSLPSNDQPETRFSIGMLHIARGSLEKSGVILAVGGETMTEWPISYVFQKRFARAVCSSFIYQQPKAGCGVTAAHHVQSHLVALPLANPSTFPLSNGHLSSLAL